MFRRALAAFLRSNGPNSPQAPLNGHVPGCTGPVTSEHFLEQRLFPAQFFPPGEHPTHRHLNQPSGTPRNKKASGPTR